jgi:hypothetical protein|tara:strand:- start:90 stop:689 length:600 start_codon:yes stop_codon:yes gene_type:complete
MELIIRSNFICGWVLELRGEELEKVKQYCKKNNEDIAFFFGGPNEEDLLLEVLGDDDKDIYDSYGSAPDLVFCSPLFDDSTRLFVKTDEDEQEIDISDITLNTDNYTISSWKDSNKDQNVIAYAFGYTSDDIIEQVYPIEGAEEFDLSKLVLTVDNNEFLGYRYLSCFKYQDENLDVPYEDELNDIEGEFFNTQFYDSK